MKGSINTLLSKFLPKNKYKIELGTIKDSFPLWRSKVVLNHKYASSHKHIIGLTRMGKSKVLESMFLQLFNQGVGVSFIDPHGSSANAILRSLIAKKYFERDDWDKKLLYIEPTEDGPFLPFNILNQPAFRPQTIGSHANEAFHRSWPSLGDASVRFDNLMLASISVLIDNGLPLPAVHLLLTRDDYRNFLLSRTSDNFMVSFFKDRYDEWAKREAPQMKDSALSRIFLLFRQPVVRYSLGQIDNVLNFREIIDSGTSVIYNLSRIQDDAVRKYFGCLITLGYEKAAVSRGDHDDPDSIDWFDHQLMIDEFQNTCPTSEDAMTTFLDQTLKRRVSLTLSHQVWDQASSRVQGSLQNVSVRLGLRLGVDDADYFRRVFGSIDPHKVKKEDLPTPLLLAEPEHKPLKGFLELQAQRDAWTQYLMDMPEREAMVKLGGKKTMHIKTADVPNYNVSTDALRDVKARYREALNMKYSVQVGDVQNYYTESHYHLARPKIITPKAFSQAYQLSSGRI